MIALGRNRPHHPAGSARKMPQGRQLLMKSTSLMIMIAMMAGLVMAPAVAQDNWPSKPVRIIVNFAPGGSTDNASRPFSDRLSRVLGQQFVIENKPGAS